jgi:hypothetical protein
VYIELYITYRFSTLRNFGHRHSNIDNDDDYDGSDGGDDNNDNDVGDDNDNGDDNNDDYNLSVFHSQSGNLQSQTLQYSIYICSYM